MDDQRGTPTLAHLTAEVAALRAQQAHLLTRARRRGTARRRLVGIALAALLVALVPLGLLAANPFTDLNPGSVHNANIDAIYNAGITTGCVPNVAYCPNDYVTREQMASFLARTAGVGANPPVANALTAVNATNAGNATTVGGYAPNGLLRVAYNGNTAGNSTVTLIGAQALIPNFITQVSLTAPGAGFIHVTFGGVLRLTCPACTATVVLGAGPALAWSTAEGTLAVAHSWVVPVASAGVATIPVLILVTNPFSAPPAAAGTFAHPTLTAIYVPFGSTGGGTLGVEEPAP